MSEMSRDQVTMSQPGPKQLGKSLAGVLSGAAQNIKSKFVNIGVTGPLVARSSPSPPDTAKTAGKAVRQVPIRVESSGDGVGEKSPHSIPLTVPGAEYGECVSDDFCHYLFIQGVPKKMLPFLFSYCKT